MQHSICKSVTSGFETEECKSQPVRETKSLATYDSSLYLHRFLIERTTELLWRYCLSLWYKISSCQVL